MKRIMVAFILIVGLFVSSGLAQTPTGPDAAVKNFYEWYLHALNQNQEPITNRTELQKRITKRLLAYIDKAMKGDGLDADVFIDAQDFDEAWERNIVIAKPTFTGQRATVNITLKGGPSFGNHKLRVVLRKENGQWKIDDVNGRTTP